MNTKKNLKIASTNVGNILRGAGHKVSDLGEHVGKQSDKLIHNVEHIVVEYGDTVTTYIKKNPLKSALIAGGLGLLLGRLLKLMKN